MKLPVDVIIAADKIKKYLLKRRQEDDKSRYLAQAGYGIENWQQLERDLREQILVKDAVFLEESAYGQVYEIRGTLISSH